MTSSTHDDDPVRRRLDEDAALARELLEQGRAAPRPLPGEDRIAATTYRLLAEQCAARERGRSSSRLGGPKAALLAAAALLIGLAVGHLLTREQGSEAPIYLGGEIDGLAPQGAVVAYDRFRWNDSLPEAAGWNFVVRVYDPSAAAPASGAVPILESPRLDRAEWEPGAAAATLPSRIRWEVWLLDPAGQGRLRGFAEAWRSH